MACVNKLDRQFGIITKFRSSPFSLHFLQRFIKLKKTPTNQLLAQLKALPFNYLPFNIILISIL
jgi:hypothetical protein